MMILRDPGLVFIKTKKTGGTSIEIALGQHLKKGDFASPLTPEEEAQRKGKRPIVRDSVRLLRERSNGEVRARQPHNGLDVVNGYLSDLAEGCTSFCVERNPWDKAVSAFYFWMHQRGIEVTKPQQMFARFCQKQLNFFSDFRLYSIDGNIAVDRVLRFENLADDLSAFLAEQGLDGVTIGAVRAKSGIRKSRGFDVYYGEDWSHPNVDRVAEVFAAEIDAFGYDLPK